MRSLRRNTSRSCGRFWGRFPNCVILFNSECLDFHFRGKTQAFLLSARECRARGVSGGTWQNRLDFPLRLRIGRRYHPFLHDWEIALSLARVSSPRSIQWLPKVSHTLSPSLCWVRWTAIKRNFIEGIGTGAFGSTLVQGASAAMHIERQRNRD